MPASVDTRIGDFIESADRRKHERRLRRAGWTRALSGERSGWAGGPAAPPRDGNDIEILIDGASALPAIAAAVRSAREFVHIAGWNVAPDFVLEREQVAVTVRDLLAEAAENVDVRMLMWAGAPVPFFHPSRAEARRTLDDLVRGTRIRAFLDKRNRPMHCHHEKLVIVDGRVAFVAGIDLTNFNGDRFDRAPHPHSNTLGWHDVAARVTGPVVADVAAHFAVRWEATTAERPPSAQSPAAAGGTRAQIIRTVPEHTYPALPRGDFGVLEAYIGALRGARRLVYLESQFLWSTEIVAVLCEHLRNPPSADFRVCIVLPSRPNNGNDDTRGQLGVLMDADRRQRLLAGTIGPLRTDQPPVYVHAKVGVVDDAWLTVGSANLNEHSLFNDTEMNVVTDDASLARSVREDLWSEHLAEDCRGRDPLDVIEEKWRPLLSASPDAKGAKRPLRPLSIGSRRAARLLGPINGLVVDG